MRRFKILILVVFAILFIFVANLLLSTGFFRTIENTFNGEIVKKIPLPGAEDITVSLTDSFALISSTDRRGFLPEEQRKDGLYFLDLKSDKYNLIHLTDFFQKPFSPHGISMMRSDHAYHVMAVNHTSEGHALEVFTLDDKKMTHVKTLSNPSIFSPNDVVMIDEERFYFTNDHGATSGVGRFLEDYAGLPMSNVVYFDGKEYREVADGIAYANGINYDPERKLLFVASPRSFLVKVYSKEEDGSLAFVEDIPCGTGVDNIEFDTEGNLWIGAHPNLLRFTAYAKGKKETAPSEIIRIDYRGEGDYAVETIYLDDGKIMSASTVASPFGDLILTGNVMDRAFLVLIRGD
jgi:arylesterase / paraoxonase